MARIFFDKPRTYARYRPVGKALLSLGSVNFSYRARCQRIYELEAMNTADYSPVTMADIIKLKVWLVGPYVCFQSNSHNEPHKIWITACSSIPELQVWVDSLHTESWCDGMMLNRFVKLIAAEFGMDVSAIRLSVVPIRTVHERGGDYEQQPVSKC